MPGAALFGTEETLARVDAPTAKIVIEGAAPGVLFADIGTAQNLLGMEDALSRLIVLPQQPLKQPALTDITPELSLRLPEAGSDVAQLTDSFHLNLTAFGLLAFAVGIFIVHGAIGLAFEQRRPTLRTLRALGLPLRRLLLLLGFELLVLALVARGAWNRAGLFHCGGPFA